MAVTTLQMLCTTVFGIRLFCGCLDPAADGRVVTNNTSVDSLTLMPLFKAVHVFEVHHV
jgi:hypothetical protein